MSDRDDDVAILFAGRSRAWIQLFAEAMRDGAAGTDNEELKAEFLESAKEAERYLANIGKRQR